MLILEVRDAFSEITLTAYLNQIWDLHPHIIKHLFFHIILNIYQFKSNKR